MAATLTPFDSLDRVDYRIIAAHTDYLITRGVQGLCPVGTTGEMLYLSVSEKVRIIEETIAAARQRVPVIAGVWSLRQSEIKMITRAAEAFGADAVFLPTPIYYPAGEDAIYSWYAFVKENTSLPVFAYNIPGYSANAISVDCIHRLVEDRIIDGIKDSTGKSDQMTMLVERFGDKIVVEAASDAFVTGAKKIGAKGFISAIANLEPELVRSVWDGDEARQSDIDLIRRRIKAGGGICVIKDLLRAKGFDFGGVRIP